MKPLLNRPGTRPTHSSTQAPERRLNILFASSEVWPLMKTGGLADVAYNLPKALAQLGLSLRVVMPGYQAAIDAAGETVEIAQLSVLQRHIKLVETHLPNCDIPLWLVIDPLFSERPGNPYQNAANNDWPDNAERFHLFCAAVSHIAAAPTTLDWQPDIVHCNDWQTGLIPVHLRPYPRRPATLFTVHNLAHQGLFPYDTFVQLGLAPSLWRFDALEFHSQLSFIKGGLIFADRINTVSPNYAKEIKTEAFGCGLETLFQQRQGGVCGILNGIDISEWNPATDKYLKKNYSREQPQFKRFNKKDLRQRFKLSQRPAKTLIGWVGRLAEQKGIELLINAMPALLKYPVQLIALGCGNDDYVAALKHWQQKCPRQLAVIDTYDEALAHQIIAAADLFLMPSRYEPCGLTQLYSLRYGTLPVANRVGGLADTIVDINNDTLANNTATGIVDAINNEEELIAAVERGLAVVNKPTVYSAVMATAMAQNFSWQASASDYLALYRELYQATQQSSAGNYCDSNCAPGYQFIRQR